MIEQGEGWAMHLGDCLDVMPTLKPVAYAITDPPYGIQNEVNTTPRLDRTGKRPAVFNDWHAPSSWDASINPAWCVELARLAPTIAWFGHWRKRPEVEAEMPHPLRAEIVWAKDTHVGPPCPLAMRDERIWVFGAAAVVGQHFDTSVWNEPIIPTWARREHKNEKPVALMKRIVVWLTEPGGEVLDPFAGSGTTGVACLRSGRRFVGIEKEREHFDVAVARLRAEEG